MCVEILEEIKDYPNVELYIGDTLCLITIVGGLINENLPVLLWLDDHFFTDHITLLISNFSRYSLDLDIKILFFR